MYNRTIWKSSDEVLWGAMIFAHLMVPGLDHDGYLNSSIFLKNFAEKHIYNNHS